MAEGALMLFDTWLPMVLSEQSLHLDELDVVKDQTLDHTAMRIHRR